MVQLILTSISRSTVPRPSESDSKPRSNLTLTQSGNSQENALQLKCHAGITNQVSSRARTQLEQRSTAEKRTKWRLRTGHHIIHQCPKPPKSGARGRNTQSHPQ